MDEEILDHAAALFAQHGFAHTSLKSLADAVGLSKAGLLHHFPSKEAIFEAAHAVSRERTQEVLDLVAGLPPGPARDRRVLELLTDVALTRPGLVSLMFQAIHSAGPTTTAVEDDDLLVFEMFAVGPDTEPDRLVRVIGALGAMAVLCLAANRIGDRTAWRQLIVATCHDTLGHRRPGIDSARHDQVEA